MHINNFLPQFGITRTMFVVCGGQQAILYLAHEGIVNEIDNVHISDPDYSDEEMSPYEYASTFGPNSFKVRADIIRQLREAVDRSDRLYNPEALYLFVPSYRKDIVLEGLTTRARNKVKKVLLGNYADFSPLQLILIVESYYTAKDEQVPQNEEARKILEKTALAN